MIWYPIGRKKIKGRPKTTWMDGIRTTLGEMRLSVERRIRD